MSSKIYWTRQAREDLRAIRAHIARDVPATASAFERRLRQNVSRLRELPLSRQVVPETGREEVREILRGHCRLIYRVTETTRVDILAVFHSARILAESDL